MPIPTSPISSLVVLSPGAEGVADWNVVLREELLDPLGMKQSSYTAEAIKAAPNHAEGYRYTPDGSVEVPFQQSRPLQRSEALAISTPILMIWRAGYACSSATVALKGDRSSRQRISR